MVVTVVIPYFNVRRSWFRAAIESALNQNFYDYEILVVDDNSVLPFAGLDYEFDNKNIRWIRNDRNIGVSATRNRGAREAYGRWLAFLDADDSWHPDKLRMQVEQMARDNTKWSYTSANILDAEGNVLDEICAECEGYILQHVLSKMVIVGSCSGVLVDRDLFLEVGGFDEYGDVVEDWDLWIRLSEVESVSIVRSPLVNTRTSCASRGNDPGKVGRVAALFRKHWAAIEYFGLVDNTKAHLYSLKAKKAVSCKEYVRAFSLAVLNVWYKKDIGQVKKAIKWLNGR
jgi:glycosyltransferase involved in cell wall biosynthesis